ncbi:MAG: glycosyltransferase [Cyclobacteriaceae bacterium]|nr:glycosyltransferase [Cyclobacteriaceae bacterium]
MATQPKRIKVLYTIPNFDTAGSGKALLNITTRLDKEKFEPHIMCMHDRGEFFKTVIASGIPVHLLEYTTPMKPYVKGIWRCWKISREFKKINPDIIHSFHYSADYSEALAARLAGIKWVYTKKNMNWGGASHNSWRLRTWLAARVVAQNQEMLVHFFPGSKKVTLIPRGVSIDEFQQKNKLVIDGLMSCRILLVANLVPVKNVETIIEALSKPLLRNLELSLDIVGDDNSSYGKDLHEQVSRLGLAKRVVFHGKQLNTLPYYHKADIFVLPSIKESSPVSLLEAMAAGIPVLASRTSGAKQIMGDFDRQLFDVGDVDALAERIHWLFLLDSESREALINRQLRRVHEHHSINSETEQHQQVYLQTMGVRTF